MNPHALFRLLLLGFLTAFQTTMAQNWVSIGPGGGYFKEFAFHPVDTATVYVGSDDGGGIWKSTDGGNTWNLSTADYPNMTGWAIEIDPANPNVVYGCDVYGRHGLLKTTDGGASWSRITAGLSTQYDRMVSGIALKTSDTLFISTGEGANTTPPRPGNGVFRSDDGGNSWTPAGLQGTTVLSIGQNVFGTIFAGTESTGLFYTNDNGATWILHLDILPTAVVYEIETRDSVIAVATPSGVYLSTNWGINFTNTGLVGEFNFDLAIRATHPDVELYGSTFTGLQAYSSASSLWTPISDSLIDNQLIIGVGARDAEVYLGLFSNSPIVRSPDAGTTFTELIASPAVTEINDLVVDLLQPNRMATTLLGTYNIGGAFNNRCIYTTTDQGLTWDRTGPKAHGLCLVSNPFEFERMFLGTFSQGLYQSDDGFQTFTQLIGGNKLVGDIAVSRRDTQVVLISEVDLDSSLVRIKRSADGGQSFGIVANLLVNRLAFDAGNEDSVYAATNNGLHLSTDYGQTWAAWRLAGEDVLALYSAGNALYAGTDAGELYAIQAGTVANVSGPWVKPVQVKSIFKSGPRLLVGLNGAEQDTTYDLNGSLWQSDDDGATWMEITQQLPHTNVYGNNVIVGAGNDVVVGTYGGGLYRADNVLLSAETSPADFPRMEIYPQPARERVRVRVPGQAVRALRLVDLAGRVQLTRTYPLTEPNAEVLLELPALSEGSYLMWVELEGGVWMVEKMVMGGK